MITLLGTKLTYPLIKGTFESMMIFRTSQGGICDRSLGGIQYWSSLPAVYPVVKLDGATLKKVS